MVEMEFQEVQSGCLNSKSRRWWWWWSNCKRWSWFTCCTDSGGVGGRWNIKCKRLSGVPGAFRWPPGGHLCWWWWRWSSNHSSSVPSGGAGGVVVEISWRWSSGILCSNSKYRWWWRWRSTCRSTSFMPCA